ncbi:MAG TPA: hypothetical protein VFD39_04585, partial [Trueperaceae bacterium]|nr:hypothetical protein [Trueperaceae bacterium]
MMRSRTPQLVRGGKGRITQLVYQSAHSLHAKVSHGRGDALHAGDDAQGLCRENRLPRVDQLSTARLGTASE